MFGPDMLVAPILYENMRSRKVYLPEGAEWRNSHSDQVYKGGQWVECDAPLDIIPLFINNKSDIKITL